MHVTRNTLSESVRAKSVVLLGTGLANAIDLERHAKQAHWNVRGPSFIGLHELFDRVAESVVEYGDLMAERIAQLGGTADGRTRTAADRSTLPPEPLETDQVGHVAALARSLAAFGEIARSSIDQATEWGDADTADVFTEVSRGIDKHLWMVEAHLAPGSQAGAP